MNVEPQNKECRISKYFIIRHSPEGMPTALVRYSAVLSVFYSPSLKNHVIMKFTSIFLSIAAFIIYTGCEQEFVKDWDNKPQDMTEAMGGVPDSLQAMNLAPLVKGYYDGGDLYFIHTEASDSAVANLLTEMMGPRVVYLPKLAQTPDSLLADVYVFKNGIEGHGPFGFHPTSLSRCPEIRIQSAAFHSPGMVERGGEYKITK